MVVFPSSGGTVYGGGADTDMIDETAGTDPITSYGITKLTFEKYLALYWHLHGLDYRILRISNAYGEGQQPDRPQGLIGVALRKLAAGHLITVWGDGTVTRDYVYAGDVAECFFVAAAKPLVPATPRIFNVGSERGHSVDEVLSTIAEVTGHSPTVHYAPPRSCDTARAVLSSQRARDILEWFPKVSLEEGIRRTWAWVLATAGRNEDPRHGSTFG